MAEVCRMRLYDIKEDFGGFLPISGVDIPLPLVNRDLKLLHIAGTGPAKAAGEFSAPSAVLGLLDGTAAAVETISSDNADSNDATGCAQKITAIGIDGNDDLVNVEMDGHGTDWTTFVLHTETWQEVFHSYISSWGSGDEDAEGNIDVRNIADTVLVQVPAASNESNGSRFCIPPNHAGMFVKARVQALDDTWTADKGGQILVYAYNTIDGSSGHVQADCALNNYTIDLYGGADGTRTIVDYPGVPYTAKTWVHTYFTQLNTGTDDLRFDFYFLIWRVSG